MNVLIANDNTEKTNRLGDLLIQLDRRIKIVGHTSTVEETIDYFIDPAIKIDLAFFKTQLSDGPTFEIFKRTKIDSPVIFTASDKSDAFEAIKARGMDYLLEPLTFHDVENALQLVDWQLETNFVDLPKNSPSTKNFKKRFIVKFGNKIQYKTIDNISYFYAEGKVVYLITKSNNRKYIIDHTMDELESYYLNPDFFFRINRKFIVNIEVIDEVRNYINSRLKLILNPAIDFDMIVSRNRVNDFKKWLNL